MSGTRDEAERVPDPESSSVNGVRDEIAEDIEIEPENELGDIGALQAKLRKVQGDLATVKKERQDYLDGWQRCKADAINQRKDFEKERTRAVQLGAENLLEALIPALDSFDMAMGSGTWQHIDPAWRKGVESIHQQILAALEGRHVTYFGSIGDHYDPMLHEVLEEMRGEGESGTVLRVIRRGWKFGEKIVRPAHVIIHPIE